MTVQTATNQVTNLQTKHSIKNSIYGEYEITPHIVAIPTNGNYVVLVSKKDFEVFINEKDNVPIQPVGYGAGILVGGETGHVLIRREQLPATKTGKEPRVVTYVAFFRAAVFPKDVVQRLSQQDLRTAIDLVSDFVALKEVDKGTRLSAKTELLRKQAEKIHKYVKY